MTHEEEELLVDKLYLQSRAQCPTCGSEGRPCEYHDGYLDGILAVLQAQAYEE